MVSGLALNTVRTTSLALFATATAVSVGLAAV